MDWRAGRATVIRARGRAALKQGIVGVRRGGRRRLTETAYNLSGEPRSAPAATTDRELASVNRTGGCQFARIKMDSLDVDHSGIDLGLRAQKLSQRLRGDIPATRESNVWMPGAKLRLEAGSERGFLHAFVNLKQMGMRLTDTDPDDFRRTLCRERSDANNGQKERAERNCAELFPQFEIDFIRDFAKETERQMHLRRVGPAHTANVRIKARK